MLNARKPHFLEVFLPNLSSNRLKVPSKFVPHLGDRTSGSFSLIGPSGNEWHINLFEYEDHLFFREGWPTFVKDHDIQCGDTLVFGYNGNSEFTVQIFDESSCEKDEAFYANSSQRNCNRGASESNELLGKRKEREKERESEASLLESIAEKKTRTNCVSKKKSTKKKCTKKKKKLKKTVTSGYDSSSKNIVNVSDSTVVLAMPAPTGADIVSFYVRKPSEVKKSGKKKQNQQNSDNKKVPSISKFIESRAAHYFTSTFPYFVRVMCYSNISGNSTLKIPCHFSRLHLPNCRIKITLMNLNGERWIVNSIPTFKRTTTMHTICGGWIAFVRANNVKIEDVCIFELVGEFELRVQVLQLGLEGLECPLGSSSVVDVDGVELGDTCLEMIENVTEDTKVNLSKGLDETNEHELHIQQEAVSSIDTVDPIAVLYPTCASASSMGTADDSTSDELLLESNGGTMSYQTSGGKEQELQTIHMKPLTEEARDTLSFTSSFPSFTKVMMSSNVGGSFTLAIPRKFSAVHLPSHRTDVILRNLSGESWNVVSTCDGNQIKFCGGWLSFARKNNVKVGDVCVFELIGEREFQVRVLEGSKKVQDHVHNESFDDSTAFVVSTEFGITSET